MSAAQPQTQTIEVPIGAGIDTRTARSKVSPPRLLDLENASLQRPGEISKRPTFANRGRKHMWPLQTGLAVGVNTIGWSIEQGKALVGGGDHLAMFGRVEPDSVGDGYNVGGTAPMLRAGDHWVQGGDYFSPSRFSVVPVARPRSDTQNVSVAVHGKYACSVFNDATTAYANIVDLETGAHVLHDLIFTSSCDNAKVVATSTHFIAVASDAGNNDLHFRTFPYSDLGGSTPARRSNTTATYTDLASTGLFDLIALPDGSAVLAYHASTGGITLQLLTSTGFAGASDNQTYTPKNTLGLFHAKFADASEKLYVLYQDNTSGNLDAVSWDTDAAVDANATLSTTPASIDLRNVTGCLAPREHALDASGETVRVFAEQESATGAYLNSILTLTVDKGLNAESSELVMRGVGLVSRAFLYDKRPHVWTAHQSTLQSTYLLQSVQGQVTAAGSTHYGAVVARVMSGDAGGHTDSKNFLSNLDAISDDEFAIAVKRQIRLAADGAVIEGLFVLCTRFGETPASALLGKSLYVGGGLPMQIDGRLQEQGFHFYPENLTSATSASGGSMSDGTYSYVAVWEWTDLYGDIHRSTPSPAVSVTLSGGGSAQRVEITVPTLKHCAFNRRAGTDLLAHVRTFIYRTTDGGTVYYKCTTEGSDGLINDPTSDTITLDDHESDASIVANERLYTDGGVVASGTAPSADFLTVAEDRLFAVEATRPNRVRCTKKKQDGEGVAWPSSFYKDVYPGGPITAIVAMDSRIYVFGEHEIRDFGGEGPNDQGVGTFSPALRLSANAGHLAGYPIKLTEAGILFHSHKGRALLNRSRQVEFVGGGVHAWRDYRATAIVLDEGRDEAVFRLEGTDVCLVLDYTVREWSTCELEVAGVAEWDGRLVAISPKGELLERDEGEKTDYPLKIGTAWLRPYALQQGYMRTQEIGLKGRWRSPHKLQVDLYYDDNDTLVETVLLDATEVPDAPELYQFRIQPKRQKCQSLRMVIQDVERGGSCLGYALDGITLDVLAKRGMNRVKSGGR